jgi:hypothetical protein
MGHSDAPDREPLDAVIAANAPKLLGASGVVGVGAGVLDGQPVIEVLTDTDPEEVRARIPSELSGYPLHVRRTGTIEALGAGQGA